MMVEWSQVENVLWLIFWNDDGDIMHLHHKIIARIGLFHEKMYPERLILDYTGLQLDNDIFRIYVLFPALRLIMS